MKRKIKIAAVFTALTISLCSCSESCSRSIVDLKSDLSGGMNRTINIYTYDGQLMRTYTGRIDMDSNDGGYIKFDLDGKRYIYYNAFAETIGDIE